MFEIDWTTVEAWDKLAEQCALPAQGRRLRIMGSMHLCSSEDSESGHKRFKTVVRAEEVMYLDTRQDHDEAEAVEDLPF